MYSQTSLFQSSTGHEKKFKIVGFQITELASSDGQTKGIRLDFEIAGTSNNRVWNSEVRLYIWDIFQLG